MGRLISFMVLLWALGFALFSIALPRPAGNEPTDAIVVLTGGPGRIERGVSLLAAHRARRMFVSGVDRSVTPADLARQAGAPLALFACCVDLGREAVDTRSNAAETAHWLRQRDYRSVRLVTTDWHMARARFELGHALRADGVRSIAILEDPVRSDPGFATLLNEYSKYLLRRIATPLGY